MHFDFTSKKAPCADLMQALFLAAGILLWPGLVQAQTGARVPVAAGHPLLGKWKLEIPNVACDGMLEFRANGTTRAVSAEQVVESNIDLAAKPSEGGFYKMSETVVTENGKTNCAGNKIAVGQSGTNFLILNGPADEFLMCAKEDINTCVGPFARQKAE